MVRNDKEKAERELEKKKDAKQSKTNTKEAKKEERLAHYGLICYDCSNTETVLDSKKRENKMQQFLCCLIFARNLYTMYALTQAEGQYPLKQYGLMIL